MTGILAVILGRCPHVLDNYLEQHFLGDTVSICFVNQYSLQELGLAIESRFDMLFSSSTIVLEEIQQNRSFSGRF